MVNQKSLVNVHFIEKISCKDSEMQESLMCDIGSRQSSETSQPCMAERGLLTRKYSPARGPCYMRRSKFTWRYTIFTNWELNRETYYMNKPSFGIFFSTAKNKKNEDKHLFRNKPDLLA